MTLRLYDTLTRAKRDFVPLDSSNVRMYVCGPTVYDFAHIGNARPVIVFDVLFRLLRHLYGDDHVTYVRNITDVDDKINARAAQDFPDLPLNEAIRKVTTETEKQFHDDVAALGCLPPNVEPRATEHIDDMKVLIEKLVKAGCAYVAEEHVLFSVSSMPDYGKLAKRSLDEMVAGARVEVAPYKRDAMDFVLWKPSKPGEPAWASPCAIKTSGRPGWHIECSAMSWRHLGETFDIHGGGVDLVFPHHENELAQSRCAFHTPVMANFWMHNGFLQVEGEKMSKSLGNFITIRDLISKLTGDEIRLTMLKSHYRQPVDWRKDELARSQSELRTWAETIVNMHLEPYFTNPDWSQLDKEMLDAFCDDLNTPLAIARLRDLAERTKRNRENGIAFACNAAFFGFQNLHHPGFYSSAIAGYVPEAKANVFHASQDLLINFKSFTANDVPSGVRNSEELLRDRGIATTITDTGDLVVAFSDVDDMSFYERVRNLINARSEARKRRDWKESDRIRDELTAMGVRIKDNPDGTSTPEIAR